LRTRFLSWPALAVLAAALGGHLGAEEITIRNASAQPWMLVWAETLGATAEPPSLFANPRDVNYLEGWATLTIQVETPGIHRARLYDVRRQSDCILQITHTAGPDATVLDVIPDPLEETVVAAALRRLSGRAVELRGPFSPEPPAFRPVSQKEKHRQAKREEQGPYLAALPHPGAVAMVLDFAEPAPAPSAPGASSSAPGGGS
jgi:hypothetical protein